jgi:predicted transposase/invertase (TIGR01784 family)
MYLMGIEQGIEQGRDRERKTIALKMLRKNISLETIAELTGLNVDRLQQLQATLSNDR